jgi:hypothetical protein
MVTILGCSSTAAFVLAEVWGEELQSNFAVEFGILSQIHLTHPAGADFLDDPIVGDHRPR